MSRLNRWLLAAILMLLPTVAFAGSTAVPGHQKNNDEDGNGFPDAGREVVGHYSSLFAEDENGDFYWERGDGTILGTVDSIADLDFETLSVCDYRVKYRGEFGNSPYLHRGWVRNEVTCSGYKYSDKTSASLLLLHRTDPRYTGDPALEIVVNWERWILNFSGTGEIPGYIIPGWPIGIE